MRAKNLLFAGPILLALSCTTKKEPVVTKDLLLGFNPLSSLPHDTKAFTQGLEIHEGQLYESTGQDNSWIGVVDIKTGIADKKIVLDKKYFGEGITIFDNKIYQLTWQSKTGFVYDANTFRRLRQFRYRTEGWGITHDSTHLIMSDGTSKLYFLDTTKLEVIKTIEVKEPSGLPLENLNELEFIEGFVFANVWQTNLIAKIDPATGEVKGYLDLTPLTRQAKSLNPNLDVLNGIAWHPATRALLVTGKYWPVIFVIKVNAQP